MNFCDFVIYNIAQVNVALRAEGRAAELRKAVVIVRGIDKDADYLAEAIANAETGLEVDCQLNEQIEEPGYEEAVQLQPVSGEFEATISRQRCEDLQGSTEADPWRSEDGVAIRAQTTVVNGKFHNDRKASWVKGVILSRAIARSIVITDVDQNPLMCCDLDWSWVEDDDDFFNVLERLRERSDDRGTVAADVDRVIPTLSAVIITIASLF